MNTRTMTTVYTRKIGNPTQQISFPDTHQRSVFPIRGDNGGLMTENIFTLLGRNETKTLPVGKPFDRSSYLGHGLIRRSSFLRLMQVVRQSTAVLRTVSF